MTARKSIFGLFILISGFLFNACSSEQGVNAAKESTETLLPAEQDFLMKVSQANQAEVQAARLVEPKTMNSDVKDFAQMLAGEHQDALESVSDLMQKYNMTPPGTLSAVGQQEWDVMSKLSGPELDREFANSMVENHKKSIDMFREQLSITRNKDIGDFVDGMLPKLQHHLEEAQKLQSKLFSGGK